MSAVSEDMHEYHVEEASYEERTKRNRLGLWLFLFSEIFLFGALLAARYYLWGNTRPDLDQTVGLITTGVLLLSSFFMNRAETAMAYGDRKTFLRGTLITIILGLVFLFGVVGVEWQIAPFGADDGAAASIFYIMTGFHAFHVLTGVFFLIIVYRNGRKGLYSAERHWPVEAAAVYWHFIDVVWVFFYPALYLIGSPIG